MIDPDIAELIGVDAGSSSSEPSFDDLFGGPVKKQDTEKVDIDKKGFPVIAKVLEDQPDPFLSDKNYYKTAMTGEGDPSQKLHALLNQFLTTQDPKDKSIYRGKVISAYWNYTIPVVAKVYSRLPVPKQMVLRYGLLLPNLLTPEQRQMLSRIPRNNTTGEPIHYMDEWLQKVSSGQMNPSATDEIKNATVKKSNHKAQAQAERLKGQKELYTTQLKRKETDIEAAEARLKQQLESLLYHDRRDDLGGVLAPYSREQKKALSDAQQMLQALGAIDKEMTQMTLQLERIQGDLVKLQEQSGGEIVEALDTKALQTEFNSVRQMIKLCVGRQGNHFPILMKQYFRPNIQEIGTRETVIQTLAMIEALDPGAFKRTFKRQTTRIVPHVLLAPCYGDRGVCWEPFEKFNRATSRGRIAIPMFPKDLKTAIISAVADLRWQVAKEKAQHYWMEEGLTGHYYQWFSDRKLRGDVKEFFIRDYLLWLLKESEGTQKLDKEVRGIFWRDIPFPQDRKDLLKNRGFVYNELYKKDINRSKTDGY